VSGRTDLLNYLDGVLPSTWRVQRRDLPAKPALTATTVAVLTEQVEVTDLLDPTVRTYTLTVLVIVPKQVDVDDDLDDALEEVLEALDLHDYLTWTTAERAVLDDTWPLYRITAQLRARHVIPEEEP